MVVLKMDFFENRFGFLRSQEFQIYNLTFLHLSLCLRLARRSLWTINVKNIKTERCHVIQFYNMNSRNIPKYVEDEVIAVFKDLF